MKIIEVTENLSKRKQQQQKQEGGGCTHISELFYPVVNIKMTKFKYSLILMKIIDELQKSHLLDALNYRTCLLIDAQT